MTLLHQHSCVENVQQLNVVHKNAKCPYQVSSKFTKAADICMLFFMSTAFKKDSISELGNTRALNLGTICILEYDLSRLPMCTLNLCKVVISSEI